MKAILTTILLTVALLTAGAAMGAIDVTLETYDRNNDGVIDEEERITLDIDIENARIRVCESMFEGGYTVTGSLILNDEFKEFAFAGTETLAPAPIADPEPSGEPKMIATEPPPPTQTPVPPPTPEDDEPVATATPPPGMTSLPIFAAIVIVGLAATGAYLYYRQKRDPEDSTEEE